MIHFFGIFEPELPRQADSSEAPFKRWAFGQAAAAPLEDEPLSPAEFDSLLLSGKAPLQGPVADQRFVDLAFQPFL